jgi:predicted PurR-regulated permease PerM
MTKEPFPPAREPAPAAYPTTEQRRILWTALTALAVVLLLGVAGLVFFGFITFLTWCYPILLPVGLAVIVALVLEPVVSYFTRQRGMKRESATLFVCALSVVGFLLFWAFLLPQLAFQMGDFFKTLPDLVNSGVAKLDESLSAPPPSPLQFHPPAVPTAALETTNELAITEPPPATPKLELPLAHPESTTLPQPSPVQAWLRANLPAIEQTLQQDVAHLAYSAMGPVTQAFGFVLGFGFVPIYVYYFLADEDRISKHWHEYVPMRASRLRDEVISSLVEINASLVSYFRGQIIVAGCNGLLTFIGLAVIGIPRFALTLGILTGALSIVPFLGIICSIIPALLLGYLSAGDDPTLKWLRPVLVLAVFAFVQLSESMFITPRVQSHSTGLHPLTIILGILFWSALLPGLLGPIVAVPLTCAVVVLMRRYIWMERAPGTVAAKARTEAN